MTVQVTPIPKPKKRKTKKKQSLSKECDVLAGRIARSLGRCQVGPPADCGGPLQWAHGFPRSYRAVRWDSRNGLCLCRDHHAYFTYRPYEWDDYLRALWGDEMYAEIRALALTHQKPDLKELVVALRETWARIEGAA